MDKKLKELVNLFEHNKKQYKGKHYDEANTRTDFIDKFFDVLGWDISNDKGYAEQYREVVREDKVEIKGKVKAPDYSFRVGGIRKFFVEAKKPSIDIKHDIGPAFQLRRYAYTAKLPLSILTDFEEFAVYDTRIKPDKNDKASTARIFYCTYDEYEKEAEFIFNTFSRDAILKGSFDKYIEGSKRKKGTSEVDKEFLKLIEKWREDLAKNIALRNRDLSIHELNYSVQKIIDRIIFLRIAEDRHTEEYGRINKLLENKKEIFPQLVDLFLKADAKYNSGLFDFKADQITPTLKIDDKVFKDIIKSLYYPDSPYEFSVFEVEILGNIYEQFLGKTIRLTAGHQAKIEDKPEVKKAGGVYYTPKYIVDYIVKNTVGEKIKNKTPEQITELKIVDPACGSGSFLLGAYQLLLDYHLEFYSKEKNLRKALKDNKIYQLRENEYRLSIEEKHKILLNNIFGVDIDSQAVEVSKLSLLLKLLEGETQESAGQLFKFSDIKLLPDLSFNIKCGNSLIGSDFYESGQMNLFEDEETVRRINVFDWDKEFPEIFTKGGFDVVIGNPPWGAKITDGRGYLSNKFKNVSDFESSQYFIFENINIINVCGSIGLIIPNTFTLNVLAKKSRDEVLKRSNISLMLDLSETDVFLGPSVRSMIIKIVKTKQDCSIWDANNSFQNLEKINTISNSKLKLLETWKEIFIKDSPKNRIISKIINENPTLSEFCEVRQGYIPYRTTTLTKRFGKLKAEDIVTNRSWHSLKKENSDYLPELQGKDVSRYSLNWSGVWVKYGEWVSTYLPIRVFSGERILIREIAGKFPNALYASITSKTYIHNPSVLAVLPNSNAISIKSILGILNSHLTSIIFKHIAPKSKKGLFPKIIITDAKRLPFPATINETNISTIKSLENCVSKMIDIQKKIRNAKVETEKNRINKQIEILENQINQLVYKLYGLTEDEIKIVEGES